MKKFLSFILIISILITSIAPAAIALSPGDISFWLENSASKYMGDAKLPYETKQLTAFPSVQMQGGNLGDLGFQPSAHNFNYAFQAPSKDWLKLVEGEAPATFSPDKISYTLADDVVKVSPSVTKNIATAGMLMSGNMTQLQSPNKIIAQGGYIRKNILDNAAKQTGNVIKEGTVVVDESTGTAFKIVSPTVFTGAFETNKDLREMVEPLKGTYALAKPELHEVIKDFRLEEETISLTRGNISGFAPNIERNICLPVLNPPPEGQGGSEAAKADKSFNLDAEKGFKYIANDSLLSLKFTDEKLNAEVGIVNIVVTVSGGLGIDSIDLTGSYSAFDGYHIGLSLKQESYLIVELDAEVHQEISIPILSIDIPFGVGRVSGGLYAIVGMDGDLRLEVIVREWTPIKVGVEGGTAFCLPTSAHPYFEQDLNCEGNVHLLGRINGYMKFGPMVGIEIFGFDLVGAGIMLGAGASVITDGTYLDITLYGIFNIYATFNGTAYNLANFRPTILNRRQTDTGGLIIKFKEVFVHPARVGGTIEKEPNKAGGAFLPANGVEYRVWVVPPDYAKNFDLNNAAHLANPGIRKYPVDGYEQTNLWGEFYQFPEAEVLRNGSLVFLEFKWNGKTYYSEPTEPILPFEKMTINYADYFNHFVTGRVQPIYVLRWDDGLPEDTYELTYYNNKPVYVSPYKGYSSGVHPHIPYGGQAESQTDDLGYFDTRIPLESPMMGLGVTVNGYFEVPGKADNAVSTDGFDVTASYLGATTRSKVEFRSTMSMAFSRVLKRVKDSYRRYEEDGKIIDSMQYDEYIWLINNNGTNTPTDEQFRYYLEPFSTQDYLADEEELENYLANNRANWMWDNSPPGTRKLTQVLDENGKPTGTAVFSQRVTVEWVWQPHPKPVKITSPDYTEVDTNGGTFNVTAEGYAPFKYTLIGAPAGVSILWGQGLFDGRMTIPPDLSPGVYKFTIRAEENRSRGLDIYEGNDPSPPDEQLFTLTVKAASSPTHRPPARTAPAIARESHGYAFEMQAGEGALIVPVNATGSTPITWSLIPAGSNPLPGALSINSGTGVLRVEPNIKTGSYYFTIEAKNDVGGDTQECSLSVVDQRVPPVIMEEEHRYEFIRHRNGDIEDIQINAVGSTPITWSLIPTQKYPLSGDISIDSETGTISIKSDIALGMHYFTVKAENAVGSDTQECRLQIQLRYEEEPSLPDRPDGPDGPDGPGRPDGPDGPEVPFIPPIRPRRPQLPGTPEKAVSLISTDNYSALPKAQFLSSANLIPGFSSTASIPGLEFKSPIQQQEFTQIGEQFLGKMYLKPNTFSVDPGMFEIVPPNAVVIRWDDPRDVYTNDRWTKNGALFVRWNSFPGVGIGNPEEVTIGKIYPNGGTGEKFIDYSPRCNNYHNKLELLKEQQEAEEFAANVKNYLSEKQFGYHYLNSEIERRQNVGGLGERLDLFPGGRLVGRSTYLDGAPLLDSMASQKGGSFSLSLDEYTGAMISGIFFVGLKENGKGTLAFVQDGATVSFAGQDITNAFELDMFNFEYFAGAFNAERMLAAAGPGGENFTFAFAYHGALPGMANFSIVTDMAEGTKVNVYKYDANSNAFTLIAGNVAVGRGGVVEYRNNTMSEYLITTKTLEGAAISNVVNQQQSGGGMIWVFLVLGLVAVVGGTVFFMMRKRKLSGLSQ